MQIHSIPYNIFKNFRGLKAFLKILLSGLFHSFSGAFPYIHYRCGINEVIVNPLSKNTLVTATKSVTPHFNFLVAYLNFRES